MALIKDYRSGYINGFLTSLSHWYNLRYLAEGDFRSLFAQWMQVPTSTESERSFYRAILASQGKEYLEDKQGHLVDSIQIVPIEGLIGELQDYIGKFLPDDDYLRLAESHGTENSNLPENWAEELLELIVDYGPGHDEGITRYIIKADELFAEIFSSHIETTVLAFEDKQYLYFLQFTLKYYYP